MTPIFFFVWIIFKSYHFVFIIKFHINVIHFYRFSKEKTTRKSIKYVFILSLARNKLNTRKKINTILQKMMSINYGVRTPLAQQPARGVKFENFGDIMFYLFMHMRHSRYGKHLIKCSIAMCFRILLVYSLTE